MSAPFDLSRIPSKPGIYQYLDMHGKIIYVGKAKNLRKRVSQYFAKTHEDRKTRQLVRMIADVDVIVTKTEDQALLLEANIIREKQPKYNIDLKGGRRYAYILLTDEKYPRLLTARDQKTKGEYFGPFVRAQLRHALLNTLRKAFFIRTCRKLPKKACLRYHIKLCKAPCVGLQSEEEYRANLEKVREFLHGKNKDLIKDLKKQMKKFADAQEFEHAREIRDQIQALEYLQTRQVIEREEYLVEDVINYLREGEKVHVMIFNVRNGVLGDKEEITLDYTEDFFDEFLRRYYEEQGSQIPKTILVPVDVEEGTQKYLSGKARHKVEVKVPVRGARKDLLDLVAKNIEAVQQGPSIVKHEFREKLGLDKEVSVIECFDISHFQGSHMVGSMVQFVDGVPNKKNYRRFKVHTVEGVDDFRAMKEVVFRRYRGLLEKEEKLPDLIVIDGGAEQLKFALKALEEAGADIPMIGLAKKFEEIYVPGGRLPRRFPKNSEMMKVLIAARNEAHRFGVSYHRLLRSKKAKE